LRANFAHVQLHSTIFDLIKENKSMAREVFETIGNDSFARATSLGRIEDDPFVSGSFTFNDTFDVYKFTVDRPTKFATGLSLNGVDADLTLFNSQQQAIKSSSNRGTNRVEFLEVEYLPAGDYFLSINKVSGGGTYTLTTDGNAIARAQLSVTVDRLTALERFDTGVPFTRLGEADFQIEIAGQKSKKFEDRNDIRPNFTVAKDVDINDKIVSAIIGVDEIDNAVDFDDLVDIDPARFSRSVVASFDVVKGEAFSSFSNFRVGENQVVRLQGNGENFGGFPPLTAKKARIEFRVNYDTFTSSSFSIPNSTPIIRGNSSSQTLTGQNQSGILCGEGGNDDLSGMGGNDILCGGTGNDKLNGGIGRDISFGGAGRDSHLGGTGRDTFVLAPNSGVDVIRDFQNNVDKLGLVMGIGFEILDIAQRGRDTVIGVGSQRLAVLSNVKADQITTADFVTVDFTHFNGVEVPIIAA
jgi:serralysin